MTTAPICALSRPGLSLPLYARTAILSTLLLASVASQPPVAIRTPVPTIESEASLGSSSRLAPQLPAFVPNVGQWKHESAFVTQVGATTAFLSDRGFVLCRRGNAASRKKTSGAAIQLEFVKAARRAPRGEMLLGGTHSYFLGSDPSCWKSNVPRYGRVRWHAPWPGIDVTLYRNGNHLEYDVEVATGADLARFEVAVTGAEQVKLAADGSLSILTAAGPLRQPPPKSWTVDTTGARTPIEVRYELRGADRFGLHSPSWDGRMALVVDPGLLWSSYLGGSGLDRIHAGHVDADGVITVVGQTRSSDFPTKIGAYDASLGGLQDVFVARLDHSRPANQQLLSATFLGGSLREWGNAVSVGKSHVAVIGSTESRDFPTTPNAHDRSHNGSHDTIAVIFDTKLSKLLYSTYLGGTQQDSGWSGVYDPATSTVTTVSGTWSTDFPTTAGAYDTTYNGGLDVAVTQIAWTKQPNEQIVTSTYFGGQSDDQPEKMTLDASGRIWLCGETRSGNFPTTSNAYDRTHRGGDLDGFAACIDPSKSGPGQLHYATLIGTSVPDFMRAIDVDRSGVVTLGGSTVGVNYPTTTNAFQRRAPGCLRGCGHGVLVRVDPSKSGQSQLVYSSYFTGTSGFTGWSEIRDLIVDASGTITFLGSVQQTPTLPTTFGAYDRTLNLQRDGYVAKLDPALAANAQLLYSTFFGGSGNDDLLRLADVSGSIATLVGVTTSRDLHTPTNAWDRTYNGGSSDAFIAQLDMRPAMVVRGTGCRGTSNSPLAVTANGNPSVPNPAFRLTVSGGPRGPKWIAASSRLLRVPVPLSPGCLLYVDPGPGLLVFTTASGSLPLPIPAQDSLLGVELSWQGFVVDLASGRFATSNALVTTLGLHR